MRLANLAGRMAGAIQRYLWNADLQKALGSGAVKSCQSSDGLMNDLKHDRVDAGDFTNAEASYRLAQGEHVADERIDCRHHVPSH